MVGLNLRKRRLVVHGLDDTDFVRAFTSGLAHTEQQWYDYVDRYHTQIPNATEALFVNLRTPQEVSSYAMLAYAVAALRGRDLLEIGCGSGSFVDDLFAVQPDLRYSGIDLCEAEIERGRAAFGRYSNVHLLQAHASQLPFDDESFDVVTSHQTFNFMPNPIPAFAEAFRVLRPGGTLIFAVNKATKFNPEGAYQQLFEAAASVLRRHYPAYRIPNLYDPRIYDDRGIFDLLREAGFDASRARIDSFDVGAMMTPEEAWGSIVRNYQLAFVSFKDEMADAVEARAMKIADIARAEIDVELGMRIVSAPRPQLA